MRLHDPDRTHDSDLAHDREHGEPAQGRARLPRPRTDASDAGAGTASTASTGSTGVAVQRFSEAVNAGVHGRALAEADTGGGAEVPAHLAARFARAGHDVGGVRLHAGASSATAAASVSARAYANGQHVHFAEGAYAPGSDAGDRLIAHEVAHTVQQRGGAAGPQFQLATSEAGDAAEHEADAVADAVVRGGPVPAITARASGIARWADASSATTVQRLIDRASPVQLRAIRTALGDAEGSADRMVPLDIPGFAGYVARADVHPLFERAQHRLAALAPPEAADGAPTETAAPAAPAEAAAPAEHDEHAEHAEHDEPGAVPWWVPWMTGRGMRPAEAAADSATRLERYVQPAQELSRRVMEDVRAGRLTPAEGAEIASSGRTALRGATRDLISPAGRGTSEMTEGTERTLGELADYYALRELRDHAHLRDVFGITTLQRGDQATEVAISAMRDSEEVQLAIIRGAGRTNGWVTGGARVMRVAGPVMMGAQLAVGGYRVLSADEGDRMYTAGEEISGFAGGTLGGAAGGVLVATMGAVAVAAGVTIAAPVSIVIGLVVVGGMAVAGDTAARSVWDRHVDRAAFREGELELTRAIEAWREATVGARIAAATMPVSPLAAGGGFHGLMERDRREHGLDGHREPETSGGEAP